jgi:hypothetical protein
MKNKGKNPAVHDNSEENGLSKHVDSEEKRSKKIKKKKMKNKKTLNNSECCAETVIPEMAAGVTSRVQEENSLCMFK